MIEGLLEQYKNNESELKLDKRENLARSIAYNLAIKSGKPLSIKEMKHLTDELFACDSPTLAPNGRSVLMMINEEEFAKRFSK
jgi:DNA mismatch repair protein MutL